MTKTPLPPKKWLKHPQSKKITEIPLKPKKDTTIPLNPKKTTKLEEI